MFFSCFRARQFPYSRDSVLKKVWDEPFKAWYFNNLPTFVAPNVSWQFNYKRFCPHIVQQHWTLWYEPLKTWKFINLPTFLLLSAPNLKSKNSAETNCSSQKLKNKLPHVSSIFLAVLTVNKNCMILLISPFKIISIK